MVDLQTHPFNFDECCDILEVKKQNVTYFYEVFLEFQLTIPDYIFGKYRKALKMQSYTKVGNYESGARKKKSPTGNVSCQVKC